MTQRIKVGNFYLDVRTENASLDNLRSAQRPLIAEKTDTPEPLEPEPYIFRPNDPFQSSIDRIEAAGRLSPTHKPWVKTAWLYVFVICPLFFMELFTLALKFQVNGGWKAFAFMHLIMLAYGFVSYSTWLDKTQGLPAKKSL
ncbi:hypothetical protein F2P44_33155 [Massilia sp. CCM 8695]|uniref:Uncharacterized protein n=1 Tax=Massilia frigida TaxID=2609281 RepID=A0ABX0NKC7_9BURK|nr:hypothetical protein [Massilia frigida]NHZ84074.1 hypothetical protein [Massilia frigida]